MHVRQIEAFRALMITQTTVGASEVLGISQPAISRIIQRLEADLGLVLFDRANGRLTPTHEAILLYKDVVDVSSSLDKLKQTVVDLKEVRTGTLSISMMPAVALGFLPSVIHRFRELSPHVSINFGMFGSAEIEQQVSNQVVDFGVVELPIQNKSIIVEDFCRSPLVCVLPSDHPLCDLDIISPPDLADVPLITLIKGQKSQILIKSAFDRYGIIPQVSILSQTNSLICQMVALGLGVGIVDPFTPINFMNQGIVVRKFMPELTFHAGIIYPGHRLLSKSAKSFLHLLREAKSRHLSNMDTKVTKKNHE